MNKVYICRHELTFHPESSRVILRPFIPSKVSLINAVIHRAMSLTEKEVDRQWVLLHRDFSERHRDIEPLLLANFALVQDHIKTKKRTSLSRHRRLLIGALFSGEYALESAALFNPSIVPHPDQSGVPAGALRFIMSLRATGEGHISSIEFRSGVIAPNGQIKVDPISRFMVLPEVVPDPTYRKESFVRKLREMGFHTSDTGNVMDGLAERFTRSELEAEVATIRTRVNVVSHSLRRTFDCISWLADSNYEISFPPELPMSERIIFPTSDNESRGIEDARFVRFTDDDDQVMYYATYTAYNGHAILPQLIETKNFNRFNVLTLNGPAVQNKGMALFPRRINGRYAMLSRQDDENLFIMFSDDPHYWSDPQLLLQPAELWESVKIGNCGSPIETAAGWLVITHGVGPMRKYCIGAALLDLDDPTKVIGRLRDPLLSAEGEDREGYVPNVVYSCGSLIHGNSLILPYAKSDIASAIATVPLDSLLSLLKSSPIQTVD